MKGVQRPLGYTIVEVMVVLAVSGVMFLIAASFINGKQARTSFQQGVNEMASQLQGVIDDVSDGHFSDVPLLCTPNGAALTVNLGAPADKDKQGTHSDCVFMGKMVHFSLAGNPKRYEIFSLVGGRVTSGGGLVTDPSTARITPAHDLTTQQAVPQNLDVVGMDVTEAASPYHVDNKNYAIGFLQGLGTPDGSTYATGAPTVRMVYALVDGNQPNPQAEGLINSTNTAFAQKVIICLSDGTRFAHLTIGGDATANNSKLAVDTTMGDSGSACHP